uniref:Uncharacterized protein n=1 Tax=Anguilla anguilla TaxID=7936 RepID=A0A0E9UYC8_ANGAN
MDPLVAELFGASSGLKSGSQGLCSGSGNGFWNGLQKSIFEERQKSKESISQEHKTQQ